MAYIGKTPASAALTSSDISDGIITSSKIANGGVETVDIADANVTAAKLASGTVQNQSAFKNIIINGDMSIAQRATSLTGITGNGFHTIDRMFLGLSSAGTWTQSQDTTVPTGQGFAKSLKMDCTTADGSLSAGDNCIIQTRTEGQNLQYLKKGTSSAESLTVSFWVYATKTGTNICELFDVDNTRQISKAYTISSSNTWEKKTLTFAGDTSGAFGNDNGLSLTLLFWLAAGSNFSSGTLSTTWTANTNANRAVGQVNHADSTSNNFYITGIQMEVGTSASDFEFLPADISLLKCQRYYYVHAEGANKNIGNTAYYRNDYIMTVVFFPTSMRSAPSMINAIVADAYKIFVNGGEDQFNGYNVGIQNATTSSAGMDCNANISGTAGHCGRALTRTSSGLLAFESEL